MTRYIVIGAGAVGATLAAGLHSAGIDHVLVGRGPNIRAIEADGLRVLRHGRETVVPVRAAADPGGVTLGPEDLLVFATKSQDVEAAARTWAWRAVEGSCHVRIAADLPVLTLQNGLDADRTLLRRFATVIGGTILTPAQHLEPGVVRSGALDALGVITVGRVPFGTDPRLPGWAEDLRAAGYIVQLSEQVSRWKAAKLLMSVRNGLDVVGGEPEDLARLSGLLVSEAQAVLAAAGVTPADPSERTEDLSRFRPDPEYGIPPGQQSTWQSFTRGSTSEIDHLNGEIVLLGRLHGVPTPHNIALQQTLGEAELLRRPPGSATAAEILALASATPSTTGALV